MTSLHAVFFGILFIAMPFIMLGGHLAIQGIFGLINYIATFVFLLIYAKKGFFTNYTYRRIIFGTKDGDKNPCQIHINQAKEMINFLKKYGFKSELVQDGNYYYNIRIL